MEEQPKEDASLTAKRAAKSFTFVRIHQGKLHGIHRQTITQMVLRVATTTVKKERIATLKFTLKVPRGGGS